MNTEIIPLNLPRGLAAISAKVPLLFVPNARTAGRFFGFFLANIRNESTRRAYYTAVCRFSEWCESRKLHDLGSVKPLHVAAYIEGLTEKVAKPTVKQHFAALRMLFDWLVVGHVLDINPAHAVRGPKHVVKKEHTPVLDRDEARAPLAAITISKTVKEPNGREKELLDLVRLHDHALIGTMIYTSEAGQGSRDKNKIGNHSLRATGTTDYLKSDGTLEYAQVMANHSSPRTTKLYDRRADEVNLDEYQKVGI
ncbi:MAG: phage integrase N-terminal SAM-like domain-containing protein [Bryobacteraceae bacterium]